MFSIACLRGIALCSIMVILQVVTRDIDSLSKKDKETIKDLNSNEANDVMRHGAVGAPIHRLKKSSGKFNAFEHIIVQMKKRFEGKSDEDSAYLVDVLQPDLTLAEQFSKNYLDEIIQKVVKPHALIMAMNSIDTPEPEKRHKSLDSIIYEDESLVEFLVATNDERAHFISTISIGVVEEQQNQDILRFKFAKRLEQIENITKELGEDVGKHFKEERQYENVYASQEEYDHVYLEFMCLKDGQVLLEVTVEKLRQSKTFFLSKICRTGPKQDLHVYIQEQDQYNTTSTISLYQNGTYLKPYPPGITINETMVKVFFSVELGNQVVSMNKFYLTSNKNFEVVSFEKDDKDGYVEKGYPMMLVLMFMCEVADSEGVFNITFDIPPYDPIIFAGTKKCSEKNLQLKNFIDDVDTTSLVIETRHNKQDVFRQGALSPFYQPVMQQQQEAAAADRIPIKMKQVLSYEDATEFYLRKTDKTHNIKIVNIYARQSKLMKPTVLYSPHETDLQVKDSMSLTLVYGCHREGSEVIELLIQFTYDGYHEQIPINMMKHCSKQKLQLQLESTGYQMGTMLMVVMTCFLGTGIGCFILWKFLEMEDEIEANLMGGGKGKGKQKRLGKVQYEHVVELPQRDLQPVTIQKEKSIEQNDDDHSDSEPEADEEDQLNDEPMNFNEDDNQLEFTGSFNAEVTQFNKNSTPKKTKEQDEQWDQMDDPSQVSFNFNEEDLKIEQLENNQSSDIKPIFKEIKPVDLQLDEVVSQHSSGVSSDLSEDQSN